jgi:hypothetical protein
MMAALIKGSAAPSMWFGSGKRVGLSTEVSVPSSSVSSYLTDGAESSSDSPYSRFNLSCTTSRWSSPRKPLLIGQRGVVQRQLVERLGQVLVVVGGHRIDGGEDHRLGFLVAGQRLRSRPLGGGDGVADGDVPHRLDAGDDIAHGTGGELTGLDLLELEHTHLLDLVFLLRVHQADGLAGLQGPLLDPAEHDHAAVGVVLGVEDQGLERRLGVALGWR